MHTVDFAFYIHARRDRVFDAVSDHETFFQGPDITYVKVTEPGTDEPRGQGALRVVHNNGARFHERITRFERPSRCDYKVEKCSIPLRHESGEVRFIERGEGTEIRWTSRFSVPVPIGAGLMEKIFGGALALELTRMLTAVKERLENQS